MSEQSTTERKGALGSEEQEIENVVWRSAYDLPIWSVASLVLLDALWKSFSRIQNKLNVRI